MNLKDITKTQVIIRSIKRKYPKPIEMGFDRLICNNKILKLYVRDYRVYCDPEFIRIRDLVRRLHKNYFKKSNVTIIFTCKEPRV